ncbi:dynein axonemal heavy chain 10 [Nothobranchius furzeri]
MGIHDIRVEWIRKTVTVSFGLTKYQESFDELLSRDSGAEETIIRFLNGVSDVDCFSWLYFLKHIREEEIEEQVPVVSRTSEQNNGVSSDPDHESFSEVESETNDNYKTEVKVVRHVELYVSLDEIPERFHKNPKDPIFYFKRNLKETIVHPVDMKEANTLMTRLIDIGMQSGDPLEAFRRQLLHIYVPWFTAEARPTAAPKKAPTDLPLKGRHSVLTSVHKYLGKLSQTIREIHAQGEIVLQIPDLDLELEVNVLLNSPEIVERLEQCVMNWQTQITTIMEEQQSNQPEAPGPIAEIELWRDRASVLSALCQQLKQPMVQKILDVTTKANPAIIHTLNGTIADLSKYHSESDNNVFFLKTLERHFLNLAAGSDFTMMKETIPEMMESLQIIWQISRHYNSNERMVPLMERIAWQLCEQVSRGLHVLKLFKVNREEAYSMVLCAKSVLEQWKSSYYDVRAAIEKSGRAPRWEFDHKRLFEISDYMASVCQDLCYVFQVQKEFHNFFDPDMKSREQIKEMLIRLDGLVSLFEEVEFDPFNISENGNWKKVMQDFDSALGVIDEETIEFVDLAFKTVHSSAAAFEMLLKFQQIPFRKAINDHLKRKFDGFLIQYCNEVDRINKIFDAEKSKPYLVKCETPVAGSITWARTLFCQIKEPMLSFLKAAQMLGSEQQSYMVKIKYKDTALRIRQYETKKYEDWLKEIENSWPLLKQPLLTIRENQDLKVPRPEQSKKRNVHYIVNFPPQLRKMISEIKPLMLLGYSVPKKAEDLAMLEHSLLRSADDLNNLIEDFHSLVDSLREEHLDMLLPHIEVVKKEMEFGLKKLNWCFLGIPEFISRGVQAVSKFKSIVNQIHNNERAIDSKLQSITLSNLLKLPVSDKSRDLPDIKDFCDCIEGEQTKTLNILTKNYSDISFLINETEYVIMKTKSGKAKCMARYYKYWECKVFDSLIEMLQRSIQTFTKVLMGNTAVFKANVVLSTGIVLEPRSDVINRMITGCIDMCVESTKRFPRWMHGTCINCPIQLVNDEEGSKKFTFFCDVSKHPQIKQSPLMVSQKIEELLLSVSRNFEYWKRYQFLWEKDRCLVTGEFAAKNPSYAKYDDEMNVFAMAKQDVNLEPRCKTESMIHLNLSPLLNTLQVIAESWIDSLGYLLNKSAKKNLFNFRDELTQLSKKLKQSPDTVNDLKSVLSTISDIRYMSVDMEIRITDIQESYRTLAIYKAEVGEDEKELVAIIDQTWSDLYTESRQVDHSLKDVKKSFAVITKEKVEEFRQNVSIFAESFNLHGPGAVGEDLDKGLSIMDKYEEDLAKIVAEWEELTNAEKLLDLPVTVCPEVTRIQKDMSGLRQAYNVYEAQKEAKARWSETLWVDLDIQMLQDNIEGFIKSLRQLPKDVRALPVAFFLDASMNEFRESLALLQDLKHEALRDRHWEELMERTGTSFEINPDSFTLENMLAMELHKYANVISDIVTSAIKELNIETQ